MIARELATFWGRASQQRETRSWRVHHFGAAPAVPVVGVSKGISKVPLTSPAEGLDLAYRELQTLRQKPQTARVEQNDLCPFALIFLICSALEYLEGWRGGEVEKANQEE